MLDCTELMKDRLPAKPTGQQSTNDQNSAEDIDIDEENSEKTYTYNAVLCADKEYYTGRQMLAAYTDFDGDILLASQGVDLGCGNVRPCDPPDDHHVLVASTFLVIRVSS